MALPQLVTWVAVNRKTEVTLQMYVDSYEGYNFNIYSITYVYLHITVFMFLK